MDFKLDIPYSRYTSNIGDDFIVYSLVYLVKKLLPGCSIEANPFRDELSRLNINNLNIIGGWLTFNPNNAIPEGAISSKTLMYGIHFYNEITCLPLIKSVVNTRVQIGCRDTYTLNICKKHGVDAYMSYCPTLLLDKVWDESKCGNYCTFVDVHDVKMINHAKSLGYDVKWLTHRDYFNHFRSFQERMDNVERPLDLYAKSRFVVSNKMHCVLPCMSMGVPCVFHKSDTGFDKTRLDDYYGYFNTVNNASDFQKIDFTSLSNKDIYPLTINKHKIKNFIDENMQK